MKKILIISSIAAALFIVISFSYSSVKNSSEQSHNNSNQTAIVPPQKQAKQIEMIDSKEGIDVSVDKIKRETNQTILTISINNHVEDYSQVNLEKRSELAGKKPTKYTVDTSASGGHHVSGELVFTGNLSGPLTIKLTDDLVFNINIP